MEILVTKANELCYGILNVRFHALRPSTYTDIEDKHKETLGYVRVSDFPAYTIRISKCSEDILKWWDKNGKRHSKDCPYQYIAEVSSEKFVRDNGAYNIHDGYSSDIYAHTFEELMGYINEVIKEQNIKYSTN